MTEEHANRNLFEDADLVAAFQQFEGWLDPGERESLLAVAPEARGRPVLDLGVGAGRTTSLFGLVTDEYLAVDVSEPMVEAFRSRHPGYEVRALDARSLDGVPDDRFALVYFSNNGLDAVDRSGRAAILAECRRVALPGGLVLVQALNVDGPSHGEAPWRLRRPHRPLSVATSPLLRSLQGALRYPRGTVRSWANYLRRPKHPASGDGWAMGHLAVHEYRLTVHFTTLGRLRSDIQEAGLELLWVRDNETGTTLEGECALGTDSFYALARRPR